MINPPSRYNLNSSVAVITGAAGLLGFIHGFALAELGCHIILTDINQQGLDTCERRILDGYPQARISKFLMDVTVPSSVKRVNEQLLEDNLCVDILINNAAINISANSVNNEMRFENFPLNTWNREVEVGLTGAILCCQVFGEQMAIRKGGVIINVASDLSVIAPNQNLYRIEGLYDGNQPVKPFSYSVIKTGLLGLTRYLATYWAKDGVRVNAISPGGVEFNQSQDFIDRISELVPMNRMCQESDIIGAIQFLSSDASSYMTGQNMIIDGGRSIW